MNLSVFAAQVAHAAIIVLEFIASPAGGRELGREILGRVLPNRNRGARR